MAYSFEARFKSYCQSLAALHEAPGRDRNDSFVLSGTSAKYCIAFETIVAAYLGLFDAFENKVSDLLQE